MTQVVTLLAPSLCKAGFDRALFLAEVLEGIGHTPRVVGFTGDEGIYPVPPPSLPLTALPRHDMPRFFATAARSLRHIDGDVVIAVKPRLNSFGIGLLARRLRGCRLILDLDDWETSWLGQPYRPDARQLARDLLRPQGGLRDPDHPWYLEQLERQVARADAVLVTTRFLQRRFGGTYLPNGASTQRFDPVQHDPDKARADHGLAGLRVLLFAGAPRPHKGLEDLLEALDRMDEPDLKLVIVGGNPYDDYDETLRARWGARIVFLPRASQEEMPEVLATAHVAVMPQRDTPTARAQCPCKLSEAMAMAKPILTTRVGDLSDLVGDTGWLVDPGSPDQLAAALREIFADPAATLATAQRARTRCIERLSVTALGETLGQVLNDLARPSRTLPVM